MTATSKTAFAFEISPRKDPTPGNDHAHPNAWFNEEDFLEEQSTPGWIWAKVRREIHPGEVVVPKGVGGAAAGTTDRLHVGHAHYLFLDAHVECIPMETVARWVAAVKTPTDPHFAPPGWFSSFTLRPMFVPHSRDFSTMKPCLLLRRLLTVGLAAAVTVAAIGLLAWPERANASAQHTAQHPVHSAFAVLESWRRRGGPTAHTAGHDPRLHHTHFGNEPNGTDRNLGNESSIPGAVYAPSPRRAWVLENPDDPGLYGLWASLESENLLAFNALPSDPFLIVLNYGITSSSDYDEGVDRLAATAVPEPSTFALVGAAFAVVGWRSRRSDARGSVSRRRARG